MNDVTTSGARRKHKSAAAARLIFYPSLIPTLALGICAGVFNYWPLLVTAVLCALITAAVLRGTTGSECLVCAVLTVPACLPYDISLCRHFIYAAELRYDIYFPSWLDVLMTAAAAPALICAEALLMALISRLLFRKQLYTELI